MYSASNIIIQTSLNSFGTNTMAAWTAYGKNQLFFWMVISAFGISITTFVGQNYGARASLGGCAKACASVSGWQWALRSSSAQSS